MALKPYLQLVRLPNVFTAAADSLAGWLLATGTFARPDAWALLALASSCVYAGGIALNDVFDAETDRAERPSRPIPSGKVPLSTAGALAAGLLIAGLGLVFVAATRFGPSVGAALVGCVVAYDAGLRRTALGPQVMGACRALNFLLGMTAAPRLGGPWCWLAAAAYGLFVAGVTWVSRSEVETGRWKTVALGGVLQGAAFAGLVGVALASRRWAVSPGDGVRMLGVVALAGLGVAVLGRTWAAVRRPEPAVIQRAVKFGILSLVGLHAGLLLAARGPGAAVAVAVFWLPAVYAGRWIYST